MPSTAQSKLQLNEPYAPSQEKSSHRRRRQARKFAGGPDRAGHLEAGVTDRRQRAKAEHIGDVLDQLLHSLRPEFNARVTELWLAWPAVVGPAVSDNTRPVAVNNRTLLVHVSSSAWLHQLQFLKREILQGLNAAVEAVDLDDIVFKIGPTS
jgi:predicted nucleic acid-binding Zn ribbon protein